MPRCQIRELNEDRKYNCRMIADVRVTYPTGTIGDELYYLCIRHYIDCLREDVSDGEEFPEGWVQQVQYLSRD